MGSIQLIKFTLFFLLNESIPDFHSLYSLLWLLRFLAISLANWKINKTQVAGR